MKHKRQTLTKEDGDDKDGCSNDGMDKCKGDKMLSMDDDEKKSCHNCDISSVGDVGSTLTGDVLELGTMRNNSNNNNNTPSATNNNNTGFNTNSNGASSVGSTNSVSSSFDKMMVEEDSRSDDESGEVTSPGAKKLSEVRVKVESGHKSPSISKQQISVGKKSPSAKDMCSVNSNGVLLAMPDSTVNTPTLVGQTATRSLTPSSTPGTPASVQLQQGSPLNIQSANVGYMQRPRSSPSSSSTQMLHGTPTTGSMSPHTARNPSVPTGNPQAHFQQSVYQHQPGSMDQYRNGSRAAQQAQNAFCTRDAYQQRVVAYPSDMHSMYSRQSQVRTSHHPPRRQMYNVAQYHHQQQQQPPPPHQYNSSEYNGYGQSGTTTAYHSGYRSSAGSGVHHQQPNSGGYPATQNYSGPALEQSAESYMGASSASGYGYPSGGTYHATEPTSTGQQHYYGEMSQQQQHQQPQHHNPEVYTPHSADYAARGGSKCHPAANYYEQNSSAGQMHVHHQGGEASSIPSAYVSSPDPFPVPVPGMTATATAIATATNSSGNVQQHQDPNSDAYNFGIHFYNDQVHAAAAAPTPSADNSNSSSDFNFLSNLANDFAPEYYQLS